MSRIVLDRHDGVAVLTIDRPEAGNALDGGMRDGLVSGLGMVHADASLSALVITGAGGDFCSGLDAQTRRLGDPYRAWDRAISALLAIEIPVVAAVSGAAFGCGLTLALAADFVLAAPDARFRADDQRLGLAPDMGMAFLLPRVVGLGRARDLLITGRTIDADEAQAIGLVGQQHDAHNVFDEAVSLARRFTTASRTAIAATKAILMRSHQSDAFGLAEAIEDVARRAAESDYHKAALDRLSSNQRLMFDWDAADHPETDAGVSGDGI